MRQIVLIDITMPEKSSVPSKQTNFFLNSILRRLRFALSLNDDATVKIFKLVDYEMPIDYLHGLMKAEDSKQFIPCRDKILALFLDGLIIAKRGKQEGPNAKPVKVLKGKDRISNNEVLRKIKIAMNYKEDDMLKILKSVSFNVGKGELSALFRNTQHRNYKTCNDQLLRYFLQGMVKRHRPDIK